MYPSMPVNSGPPYTEVLSAGFETLPVRINEQRRVELSRRPEWELNPPVSVLQTHP